MHSGTVLALHAHPDDEAIFTGGTLALLADRGWRVVLVVATSGEAGQPLADEGPGELGRLRRRETRQAAAALGVARTVFLGWADSGLDAGARLPGAFTDAPVDDVAWAVAAVAVDERACALITYDEGGIYPHPDHLMVHAVGRRAAELAGLPTWYEATVDREHLHFVDTHLVGVAAASLPDARVGMATAEISTTVDVRRALAWKRAAIEAHASQIPDRWGPLALLPDAFAATYGYEWFVRHGAPGPIEELPAPGRRAAGGTVAAPAASARVYANATRATVDSDT